MKKVGYLSIFFISLFLGSTALALPIDHFIDYQHVLCSQTSCLESNAVSINNSFSNYRKSKLSMSVGSSNSISIGEQYQSGYIFSSLRNTYGDAWLFWDGTQEPSDTITNGGLNYNISGDNVIRLVLGDISSYYGDTPIYIVLYDSRYLSNASGGNYLNFNYSTNLLASDSNTILDIPFSAFRSANPAVTIANSDFLQHLGAVGLRVIGNVERFQLKCIETVNTNSNASNCIAPTPTPTRTSTRTRTPSPTQTFTRTSTPTKTSSPTNTPLNFVPTNTPTFTPLPYFPTFTPTSVANYTNTPIAIPTAYSDGCTAKSNASRINSLSNAAVRLEKLVASILKPAIKRIQNQKDRYSLQYLNNANKVISASAELKRSILEIYQSAPAFDNSCLAAQSCQTYSYANNKKLYAKRIKQLSRQATKANKVKATVRAVFPSPSLGNATTDSRSVKKAKKLLNNSLKLNNTVPASTKICN